MGLGLGLGLLLLSLGEPGWAGGCLSCDPSFMEEMEKLLGEMIPQEAPTRPALLERQLQALRDPDPQGLGVEKRLRVLDVRGAATLRLWLKKKILALKEEPQKGVFILQGQLLRIRGELRLRLREALRAFSNLACSEDCTLNEGPVLDCWTCLRISTSCFRGELCGDENPWVAEQREVTLFLVLLVEAVVLGSAMLLFLLCVSHRKRMKELRASRETKTEEK
ncbi:izumo sperm-egg fusion protein 3 [Tachyglossus aculeatus]|uniref:izumo sperm-egg fusion protein 3 n=1 Tax=Tachyglossus aculeatus TaxID=9261 RepID=UPI0018F748D9|nr:izumo sperm-egg fusion protein 3 [Tachyglossus aculeatus]